MPQVPGAHGGPSEPPTSGNSHLGNADGSNAKNDAAVLGRVADATRGWHALNMAVAQSLPTSLLTAGQYAVASRRTFKRIGRRR